MNVNAKIVYNEEYLPTKRHRIPRIREVEEVVEIELREASKEAAKLALVTTNYKSYLDENGQSDFGLRNTEYFAIDGELYSQEKDMSGALDCGQYPLEKMMRDIEEYGERRVYAHGAARTKEMVLDELKKYVDRYLVVDGEVYSKRGEPRYVVQTFGLGHNHGGTGVFISNHYNPNLRKDSYFNALQRDAAIAYADSVAARRGDTNSVGTFGGIDIKVYMPEMVRCNPQMEHGDGSPLLNDLEDLVQGSDSSLEAGLLVMSGVATGKLGLDAQISVAEQQKSEPKGLGVKTVAREDR